jgi:SAM-dependent methyltransferase
MDFSQRLIETSGYDRTGFAAGYDRNRPRPPELLLETLCLYAGLERPQLVVDLGCGTGLSARAWAGRSERVVGVEPNGAMLAEAERAEGVEYRQAFAQDTRLDEGCADIVTCSQSLHWMEPEPTFAEAARILRPGGVFAAYDYDWPPVVHPEVDAAFDAYQRRRGELRESRGLTRGGDIWRKTEHLQRMRESRRFSFCREIVLHSMEQGDANRLVGFAYSLGCPAVGMGEEEIERELRVSELEEVARRVLGERTVPFLFGYRVRIGVV